MQRAYLTRSHAFLRAQTILRPNPCCRAGWLHPPHRFFPHVALIASGHQDRSRCSLRVLSLLPFVYAFFLAFHCSQKCASCCYKPFVFWEARIDVMDMSGLKSVRFGGDNEKRDSAPDEKILSRKPTPFNQALSAEIRRAGLAAVCKDDVSAEHQSQERHCPEHRDDVSSLCQTQALLVPEKLFRQHQEQGFVLVADVCATNDLTATDSCRGGVQANDLSEANKHVHGDPEHLALPVDVAPEFQVRVSPTDEVDLRSR